MPGIKKNIDQVENRLHKVHRLYKGSGHKRQEQGQPFPVGIDRKDQSGRRSQE